MRSIRRSMFWRSLAIAAGIVILPVGGAVAADQVRPSPQRPNVIIVLTDDQGYGDLSCHGNPLLKTPNLDKLHDQAIRFTDFHVAPMCTPTRGQIVTGVDCLANGAWIVCSGRSLVRKGFPAVAPGADIPGLTIGDIFHANGYRTGHFGKWHLGDNYPYRAMDRGFEESITIRGWGIVSSQDYWLNGYYDDHYWHNGKPEQYHGYCTDVWFGEAMKWMQSRADRHEPFLVYLPTNAPHVPLLVPEKYALPYKGKVPEPVAKYFGMIACIDENMGKLDAMLKASGLYENTIVVFMSDNGGESAVKFFNAGMRGHKTDYYEGGHRVPCFIRWPAGGLRSPVDVTDLVQCQDVFPTLVNLCGLHLPNENRLDGVSLAGVLRGQPQPNLADRKLVVQFGLWGEYEAPKKWSCCVMWNKWRLIRGKDLFDIAADPAQKNNVAKDHPEIVDALCKHYEQWWARTEPLTREFQPIHVGSEHENPVFLGTEDWVHWGPGNMYGIREGINRSGPPWNGPWHVLAEREGQYEISLRRWPVEADAPIAAGVPPFKGKLTSMKEGKALPIAKARLVVGGTDQSKPVVQSDKAAIFTVHLPAGQTTLQTWFYDKNDKELCGAFYVYVRFIP